MELNDGAGEEGWLMGRLVDLEVSRIQSATHDLGLMTSMLPYSLLVAYFLRCTRHGSTVTLFQDLRLGNSVVT